MQIEIHRKAKGLRTFILYELSISADTAPNVGDIIIYDGKDHIVTDRKWEIPKQEKSGLKCILYIENI